MQQRCAEAGAGFAYLWLLMGLVPQAVQLSDGQHGLVFCWVVAASSSDTGICGCVTVSL